MVRQMSIRRTNDRGIAATWLFQHAADTQNVRFRAIPIAAAGDPRAG
ncbi:MAG: hypothetical protein K9L70_05840 [Thiohalocapsa sp.]|nr:hypothetical protein [Thiohalocapsa sp.]MCF7990705.1 hypothetical protein [Thiohalocapsa sp.]